MNRRPAARSYRQCAAGNDLTTAPHLPPSRIIAKLPIVMTKRQLGWLMIVASGLGIVGLFGMDLLGAGQFRGIGPAQRLALLGLGAALLVGVSLLPLGDKPA